MNDINIKIEKQEEKYLLIIQTPENQIIHPFVPIPAGSFLRSDDATVSVNAFYMAQFPMTQEVYEAIIGENPSEFKGKQNPVENISWYESVEFCEILNRKLKIASPFYKIDKNKKDVNNLKTEDNKKWTVDFNTKGKGFRLPTEAEWEYAGRVKSITKHEVWSDYIEGYKTKPVGLKFPNEFGLYDVCCNVWQLCWDWFGDYDLAKTDNPIGADKGSFRVSVGYQIELANARQRLEFLHFSYPGRLEPQSCRLAFVP